MNFSKSHLFAKHQWMKNILVHTGTELFVFDRKQCRHSPTAFTTDSALKTMPFWAMKDLEFKECDFLYKLFFLPSETIDA